MRNDGPFPVILFVLISFTLVLMCYLMSRVQIPTTPGIESVAAPGDATCFSYFGTPERC